MGGPETETVLSAAEYAVYGVLCAAKRETGPEGARRLSRIQERLDWEFTEGELADALRGLMQRGWVRQCDAILGMIHYEATDE